jgi:lipoprotein-anchoring transpeptidase ErfK/SrfK
MVKIFWRNLKGVAAAALLGSAFLALPAHATVNVNIDISSQTMTVSVEGSHYATWRVSTARDGYYTPRGSFKPFSLRKMHYSRKYDMTPMPHSIFFRGGYAIHATNAVKALGRPASHGCIRLSPKNAATLFNLVRAYGMKDTRISIRE